MKFRSYFGDTKRNLPMKVRALEFFINFHYWQIKVKGEGELTYLQGVYRYLTICQSDNSDD